MTLIPGSIRDQLFVRAKSGTAKLALSNLAGCTAMSGIVERVFAWIQLRRRLLVRWEYYPTNFLGFAQLAALCHKLSLMFRLSMRCGWALTPGGLLCGRHFGPRNGHVWGN